MLKKKRGDRGFCHWIKKTIYCWAGWAAGASQQEPQRRELRSRRGLRSIGQGRQAAGGSRGSFAGRGRLGRSSSFRRGSGLGRHVFDGQGFDLEHGGFIAGTRAGHIGVAQRGHHEDHGHEGGHLGQHAAGTAAAEHRGIAATENDAHTFLAGLQENENDEHHTNNDMKRQNKGLHKSLPGARRK
mgnify:CR=1 FL=1